MEDCVDIGSTAGSAFLFLGKGALETGASKSSKMEDDMDIGSAAPFDCMRVGHTLTLSNASLSSSCLTWAFIIFKPTSAMPLAHRVVHNVVVREVRRSYSTERELKMEGTW